MKFYKRWSSTRLKRGVFIGCFPAEKENGRGCYFWFALTVRRSASIILWWKLCVTGYENYQCFVKRSTRKRSFVWDVRGWGWYGVLFGCFCWNSEWFYCLFRYIEFVEVYIVLNQRSVTFSNLWVMIDF